jgi:ABC-2 type transport system permease protein
MLSGVRAQLGWLEVPVLVALLFFLATGVGMLLSALYVRFRDLEPIWDVALRVLFYGSPILYVASTYPESVRRFLGASPIAAILTEMRRAFIDPDAPGAASVVGGAPWLLVPLGIVFGIFALGWWVFNHEAPRIAENL